MPSFADTADRIRALLHNHPRSQYVRLTKAEAQAVIAAAPLTKLSVGTADLTRRIARKVILANVNASDDAVADSVATVAQERWLGQEVRRSVEVIDRSLADIASIANEARRELREGRLPTMLVTGSSWDQLQRELRERTIRADALIDGAAAYAYATAPREGGQDA